MAAGRRRHHGMMETFLFRCPRTGQRVQGFVADDARDDNAVVQVTCHARGSVHFVNPKTEAADDDK
jgi:hypothetical protein